ncbi:MAG TPA: dTDP-4-dehydrorhamnose reductase [Myxococcota bacterium]|nr:dTDP-4-dehydrorhamnose reductase [Myxococcota bacterium]
MSRAAPGEGWLVTGAGGQLGSALVAELSRRGARVVGRDAAAFDVADADAVARALADARPAWLLNAAAYTDVDGCERDPVRAKTVNAQAPALLAERCREAGVRLFHVSTDYVFDGRAARPLREDDPVAPLSEYGRSKLAGERAVLAASPEFTVVRTSWVFGRGRNFIRAILARAGAARADPGLGPLRVVDDQVGSPTWADDLAPAVLALLERGGRGLYHLANRGAASRLELARLALDAAGHADLEIVPVKTADYPLPAQRPLYTALDCGRAERLGAVLRPWQEAVRAYVASTPDPAASGR